MNGIDCSEPKLCKVIVVLDSFSCWQTLKTFKRLVVIDPYDTVSEEFLERLTGLSQPAAQCKFFRDYGVHFLINKATGRPSLTYEALTRQLANRASQSYNRSLDGPRLEQV